MDWGIWLIVAFVGLGFTIVALLWWIRFPKAASIVMRGQHVIITGGSSGIGLALAQLREPRLSLLLLATPKNWQPLKLLYKSIASRSIQAHITDHRYHLK